MEKEGFKAYVLTSCLIESLDKLPKENFYVQSLKRKGNVFLKELERVSDTVWDNMGGHEAQAMDTIVKCTKVLDDLFEQ